MIDRVARDLKRLVGLALPGVCFGAILRRQRGWGPSCTVSFDCDFPRDVEAVSEVFSLLEARDLRGSFACVGRWIRTFPDEHRQIVTAGLEILNHTETHPNLYHPGYDYARGDDMARERFNEISSERRKSEIEACHETCVEVLGYEPRGFRSPHFGNLHVDEVYPVLADLGYLYSSSALAGSSVSGGLPFRHTSGVLEFPLSPCPRHPFGVFDSWHSLGKRNGAHPESGEMTRLFRQYAELILAEGGYANVYFDPRDMLDSGELVRFLDCLQDSGLEVVAYGTLATRAELEEGDKGHRAED